ncbi:zinc finger domain-containing protein [Candidatus Woesearchaeota archaeon]|nr:zinc finger domain-containing protein [Candidatus Woesearchaeota archaeon]
MNCISCKKSVENEQGVTKFDCPNCGKSEIVRCKSCKKIAALYKCPECGFEGPN